MLIKANMKNNKDEVNPIEYRLKLYQIRARLQKKGIIQPVKEMIEQGLIPKNKENSNFLLGRTINVSFLEALERFENNLID